MPIMGEFKKSKCLHACMCVVQSCQFTHGKNTQLTIDSIPFLTFPLLNLKEFSLGLYRNQNKRQYQQRPSTVSKLLLLSSLPKECQLCIPLPRHSVTGHLLPGEKKLNKYLHLTYSLVGLLKMDQCFSINEIHLYFKINIL